MKTITSLALLTLLLGVSCTTSSREIVGDRSQISDPAGAGSRSREPLDAHSQPEAVQDPRAFGIRGGGVSDNPQPTLPTRDTESPNQK